MTCQVSGVCSLQWKKKRKWCSGSLRAGEELRSAPVIASNPNPWWIKGDPESQMAEVIHRMDSVEHFQFYLRLKHPVLWVGGGFLIQLPPLLFPSGWTREEAISLVFNQNGGGVKGAAERDDAHAVFVLFACDFKLWTSCYAQDVHN